MPAQPLPVLVGVGQILQRSEDPREAAEPLELMIAALERAGEDSSAPQLLRRAGSLYVVRGMWGYGDPGRAIAARIGASPRETVSTPFGGNYAQACVFDAAREIAAGRCEVALVTGAENGRSAGQAERRGVALPQTEVPGAPDRKIAEDGPIFHAAELARGMNSASDVFAVVDSAIRFARGETPAAHAERIASLWAGLSAVAGGNPHAWIREPCSAEEIRRATAENPMISYPYTRLMNANSRVDMAAGLVLCSEEAARGAGIPAGRIVYLHAATEASEGLLSTRAELHRSPALQAAGARLFELTGRSVGEIDHVDLYSCFPSALQVAARELGVTEQRALSVTGGLTFGGGPMNSYGLHAVARMAERVRERRGASGLVHGNGGWLQKHSVGLYSCEPPRAFRYEHVRGTSKERDFRIDWDGPVSVDGYTVAHRKGEPRLAHVACLCDDGHRTWATLDDPALLRAMMDEEFCGRRGRIDGRGGLRLN